MKQFNYLSLVLIAAILSLTACGGDDPMMNPDDPMEEEFSVLTPCIFSIDVGGDEFNEEETLTGNLVCNVSSFVSGNSNGTSDFVAGGHLSDFDTDYGLLVSRGTLERANGQVPGPDAEFLALFQVGKYPITQEANAGFEVFFEDRNGGKWSSTNDNADQSNSEFEILEVVNEVIFDELNVKIKAKYNCNLYNTITGEVKASSGTLTLGFKNF
jgi:hypothetical protein